MAYFGASVLFIRTRTMGTDFPTSIIPTKESDLHCGGYLIESNSY